MKEIIKEALEKIRTEFMQNQELNSEWKWGNLEGKIDMLHIIAKEVLINNEDGELLQEINDTLYVIKNHYEKY